VTAAPPLQFLFGVHVHQPVGNFDHVFAQHVDEVYLPLLRALDDHDTFPIAVHVSGPLLEWLREHDRRYLDLIGRLVADGKVELLLAGCYEPILAALPRDDRVEQILWMRDLLRETLGAPGSSLWLTERIWEPDLAVELVQAGVESVLVDDRHFLVNGFPRERLHAPFRTESGGHALWILPIDERLRYLVPFRPPGETASYFQTLRDGGQRLAVLADDGEKFGGWPGTREWVYDRGWLREFLETIDRLRAEGTLVLSTPERAIRTVPSAGLAYLPTASYREMEGWALWPDAARRLRQIETEFGEQRMEGPDGTLVRGTHWRNFLAKYPESNRMHKKMLRLSRMARAAGDPPAARRAIGRAQCNDAYWHGVFGGLYLPHLRGAIWRELARAEGQLRAEEPLGWERADVDEDGHDELWIHSPAFSAIVSPRRGGGIEEYTRFATGVNHADVLTRRLEAYHEVVAPSHGAATAGMGTPSIHAIERGLALAELPPVDAEPRALFLERLLRADATKAGFTTGRLDPIRSWAGMPLACEAVTDGDHVRVALSPAGAPTAFRKVYVFGHAGLVAVEFSWRAPDGDSWFSTEVSHQGPLGLRPTPAAEHWTYPVETLAKSERGFERAVQGQAAVLRWPASLGGAVVTMELPGTP
jgi:4-alpha-glucanotransferase